MATPNDIYNEITRIDNAKQGIAEAIEEKGVQVPAGTPIQDFPGKVRQIQTGSPDAVLYTPQDLTPEQQEQARENIGAYTKPETGIPAADLAEPVQQELAKAETAYQKPGTGIPKSDLADGVQTSLEKADTALQPAALTPITQLIPEQATPQNQLADKNFVNSSVATNTANYISDNGQPFQSVADLEAYTGTLTNNDYAFVVGTDSAGNTTYTRYKYNANTGEWAEEYVLNNSSFTAEQWAAISSGITALLVQKLLELPTEIVTYAAQTLTEAQKQQARTNIGATAPEIFVAIYGQTTVAQIQAGIDAGKVVIVKMNGTGFFAILQSQDDTYYRFYYNTGGVQIITVTLNKTTGAWATSSLGVQGTNSRTSNIIGNRNQTALYPNTKGVFDLVGKYGVVSQTQTWTPTTGAYPRTYTMTNQVYGMIPQANIDLYIAAGATFNETTGYFELNGLTDISYQEMAIIYSEYVSNPWTNQQGMFTFNYGRTNLPPKNNIGSVTGFSALRLCYGSNNAEALVFLSNTTQKPQFNNMQLAFFNLLKLKNVITEINVSQATNYGQTFNNCYTLESVKLFGVKASFDIIHSPNLNLESVVYAVQNATNTTAITITLHATAYARCVADTTEYTYDGQTYTGIIAYAAARNITIASA